MADDLAWETLDRRVSYSCDGFDVVTDDVRLPDGTVTEFDFLTEPQAVVILPFTMPGNVVVIEEWRQAVGRVNRGLPAGSIEPDDEDFEAAAHRELAEETGYEATEMEHLTTAEPANGFADSVFHYYVATGCTPTADLEPDDTEDFRVETTEFEELVNAAREDELRDGRSMLGVLYYALFEE